MWGGKSTNLSVRAARVRYPLLLRLMAVLFVALAIDAFLLGLIASGLRRAGLEYNAARALAALLPCALLSLMFLVRWLQVRRVRRLLARHGYLLCVQCYYPLSSDEENGRCPECSEWFQTGDVIAAWQEWESLQSTPVHGA